MAIVKEVGTRGKLHAEFNSVAEVFRVIDKLNWTPKHSKSSDDSGRGYGGFHTFNSLAEARDIFQNHPERVREFSINDTRLETHDSPGKDVSYDVTGDFLDIDRYLEGTPEVWGNAVLGNPKSVFCTINVLNSFVSYTDSAYQLVKQQRVLRLVDWLETQGVRCQIVLSADSVIDFTSMIVKEFQDPFDLNQLAIAMHPDWLRRIYFLIKEQSKTWQSGYGSSIDYDKRMIKYKPQPEDGVYVYVGGYIPYDGKDNGAAKLNEKFDEIEKEIEQLIADGYTFNEKPLTIAGNTIGSGY